MRFGFLQDEGGLSTPQVALAAGALAIASLVGVRLLEAPLGNKNQASISTESATDLERLARTIPAATGHSARPFFPSSGQIDFTATAKNSTKRGVQSACHSGERTVTMVAPAGGPPTVLSTCAPAKSSVD